MSKASLVDESKHIQTHFRNAKKLFSEVEHALISGDPQSAKTINEDLIKATLELDWAIDYYIRENELPFVNN